MRKLTRNPLIPDVLAQYNANTDSWSLSSPNKKPGNNMASNKFHAK